MSSLAGTLLVARSALRDTFFGRSVILLLKHDADSAFGLVLNRPHEAAEKDEDAEKPPFPIFIGGPCELDGYLMIHGEEEWLEESGEAPAEVCPGVYLGDMACFEKVNNGDADPAWKYRVFHGYAGWGPEQLESELAQGAWIVLPAQGEAIFTTPVEELWERFAPQAVPQPSLN